jgi:hypothetical protein
LTQVATSLPAIKATRETIKRLRDLDAHRWPFGETPKHALERSLATSPR